MTDKLPDCVTDELDELRQLDDPVAVIRRANELLSKRQEAIAKVTAIRRGMLNELVSQGKTHTEIAALTGMTRARVSQCLSTGPRLRRSTSTASHRDATLRCGEAVRDPARDPGSSP